MKTYTLAKQIKSLKYVLLLFFTYSGTVTGQNSVATCDSVKEGTFYYVNKESRTAYSIIRHDGIQCEINLATKDTTFFDEYWIDNCTLQLTFNRSTKPIPPFMKKYFESHHSVSTIKQVNKDFYVFRMGIDSINAPHALEDTVWRKPLDR